MMMRVFAMSLNVDGGAGRALLVAALLISAYALLSYWRSLGGRSSEVRLALVSLRGLALVLMSCALAGVRVEYEGTARARVLLRTVSGGEAGADGGDKPGAGSLTGAREQTIAALRARGFEVVLADDEGGAQTARERGGSFAAGVLLTTGAMDSTRAGNEVEGTNAAAGGAPVFVVTNYPAGLGPGVAMESVTVLGRAVRGVPVAVRAVVHARGMRGRESLLTISDDAKAQGAARVVWTGDDERQAVTIALVPKAAGWANYSAKVEAANNEDAAQLARPFTVYVEERRLRVLFFESEPTWEAKFIRRALEQSGLFEVDYLAQVSRAATIGISDESAGGDVEEPGATGAKKKSGAATAASQAKLRAALQSAAALNAYDCVVVGATENSLLSAAESARLREWVARRGGGLVVLGGNSFNGSIVAPSGKLYSLLPTEIGAQSFASGEREVSRGRPLEAEKTGGGATLTPTEAGAGGALFGYLNAGEEAAAKAAALSGQGFRLGDLRPGASVLAVSGQANTNGTSETGAALIAAMRYGAGRTLAFAPADSWRIRTSASGDEDDAGGAFNALWQGIVLWTAAGARPPAEVVLSDESPAEGSSVTAEIRVRDASFTPLKIEKLNARLQPLAEDAGDNSAGVPRPREIGFAPDPADASVWRARFTAPARGRFVLETEYRAGAQSGNIGKHFAVVVASARETGAALDALRRAARESGGETIDAADKDALFRRLAAIPSSAESVRRAWELRSWWPLALLIPLLLSTEWFLRRWWKID
jgi:hypothetical protein